MARKLKVFSAEMGFVRAVVAAPSRKAALEAWGVRDDLFARGTAKEEADPTLVEQALAEPGEVVRAPIASGAEIVSAAESTKAGRTKPSPAPSPAAKARPPSKPPPPRKQLDKAKAALTAAETEQRDALKDIETEQADLDRKRKALETRLSKQLRTLTDERDRAQKAYDKALKAWDG